MTTKAPGTELAEYKAESEFALPDPEETRSLLQAIRAFQSVCKTQMVQGADYGIIPGTQKPTLLKPGAEKVIRLLGLADEYDVLQDEKDWGRGFFHFQIRCRLVHLKSGKTVSNGLGECNSMESKYRWRWVWERELPAGFVKEGATFRSTRNGGKQYRLENEDIYSQVNTLLKMAKKRAMVDAALSAGRLSEIFTQDTEDLTPDRPEADEPVIPREPDRRQQAPARPPSTTVPTRGVTCLQDGKLWARGPTGRIGHPVGDGTWHWRDEVATAPAPPEPEGGVEQPEFEDTPLAELQRDVAKEMAWADFEKYVLDRTWPEWVRLGQTIDTARTRWSRWKSQQKT